MGGVLWGIGVVLLDIYPKPLPAFGVAIGKGEDRAAIMADGGGISPVVPIKAEDAIVNGLLAFVHKNDGFGGGGASDLGQLFEHGKFSFQSA